MKTLAFFYAKDYDKTEFDHLNNGRYDIRYFEDRLLPETVIMAKDCDAICATSNSPVNAAVLEKMREFDINIVALRMAGYNHVDLETAKKYGIKVVRVPAYSPYAIAEHAITLLLMLNRNTHKGAARSRIFNFALSGLIGNDMHGKTVGIVGYGRIGQCFANICKGFGMRVLAYNHNPKSDEGVEFVDFETLLKESDAISLHCPLTPETKYLINEESINKMKDGVYIVNTARGAIVDSKALLRALQSGKVAGAGLDVLDGEDQWVFENKAFSTRQDETLALLSCHPNVIITAHQAYLTKEALRGIAGTTLDNLDEFFAGKPLTNEVHA